MYAPNRFLYPRYFKLTAIGVLVLWYGMCVDFLYETLSLDHPDPFIRYMSLCSAFAFVLYLAAEHVAVTLILFFKNANIRYWKTTYREFRLICYSTRLVRDAYEIIIICESKKQLFLPKSYGLWSIFELLFGSVELLNYLYEKHLPLFYDVVMYTCDAALDYEKLKQIRRYTPGFSSGLGLLSALIRCLLMLDPCTRLLPRVSW